MSTFVRSRALSQPNVSMSDQDAGILLRIEGKVDSLLEKNIANPAGNGAVAPRVGIRPVPMPGRDASHEVDLDTEFFRGSPLFEWELVVAPDGSKNGYYSEHHNDMVKVVRNKRGKEEVLLSNDPMYEQF